MDVYSDHAVSLSDAVICLQSSNSYPELHLVNCFSTTCAFFIYSFKTGGYQRTPGGSVGNLSSLKATQSYNVSTSRYDKLNASSIVFKYLYLANSLIFNMNNSNFVYQSIRMLCATPEFGDQLFNSLTPVDLSALLYVASRKHTLSSFENFDFGVCEKTKHFREFAKNDNFDQVLQSDIYARYCELIMGRDLPDDRTMPSAWLDLTITSAVKHEKDCESCHIGIRADHNLSTALWYGEKTMQKWSDSNTAGSPASVLLKMDASAMNMPMNIGMSKFWCVTRVVSRVPSTGAYLFRQQRSFDYPAPRIMLLYMVLEQA
ncbi:hypothetical protein EJ07DRAFT_150459 [Lizonia empirigonia]|nr:hypothetical protein EJ07DRAFT_150459 [Lizonia empirigonia]